MGVTWESHAGHAGHRQRRAGPGDVVCKATRIRLAIGDLNEDGHLDARHEQSARDLVWTRRRHLRTAARASTPWTFGPRACTDVNRDGVPDIVLSGSNGVLLGQRSQTNRAPIADAGPDVTLTYRETFNDDEEDSFYFSGLELLRSGPAQPHLRVERSSRRLAV